MFDILYAIYQLNKFIVYWILILNVSKIKCAKYFISLHDEAGKDIMNNYDEP